MLPINKKILILIIFTAIIVLAGFCFTKEIWAVCSWTTGKVGSALQLNGSTDYVDVGNVYNGVKSIEFWVKPDDITSHTDYIVDLNGTDYIKIVDGEVTVNNISDPTYYVDGISGEQTIPDTTNWHHVVITTETGINASDLDIGRLEGTGFLGGGIDEVKLYNRVLPAAEVRFHYNRGAPVAYWKFDEGTGTTTYDASENANNGTLGDGTCLPGTSTCPSWTSGKYSTALQFDGVDDYVEVPHSSSLNISDEITLSAWVYDPPAGWLSGWSKRVKITIDHNDIDDNLLWFPVLLHVSTSSGINSEDVSFIFDEVGANYQKIAVTEDDGTTELKVEVEEWDNTSTEAWLWVSTSTWTISSSTDTDLYLYYDNTHANNPNVGLTNSSAAEAVWDSYFKATYHLTETSGNYEDSTANNHDITTISGVSRGQTGQIYYGLLSDSVDYMTTANSADFSPGTETFAVEFWVKSTLTTQNGWNAVWRDYGNDTDNLIIIVLAENDDKVTASFRDENANSIDVVGTTDLGTTNWWHVVAVRDSQTTGKIYLNGTQDGSGSNGSSGTITTSDGSVPYLLNQSTGDYNALDAYLDEIRIHKGTARSVAWWKATYETGRDHLLDWESEEYVATITGKGGDAYQLAIDNNLNVTGYINGTAAVTSQITKTWHHLALSYDRSNVRLYVDGIEKDSYATTAAINTNTDNLKIGELIPGKIDDVRIYNYVRMPDEIRLDYNAGFSARFGPLSSCDHDPGGCMDLDLVGYWSFDEGGGQTAYDSSGQDHHGTVGTLVPEEGSLCCDGLDNDIDGNTDCDDSGCDETPCDTGSGNYIYCRDNHMWAETLASGKTWGCDGYECGNCPSNPETNPGPSFPACYACYTLSYAGFSDWILPDSSTLDGAWEADGDAFDCEAGACTAWDSYCCNSSASYPYCYWTTIEIDEESSYNVRFDNGALGAAYKSDSLSVRCVRQ